MTDDYSGIAGLLEELPAAVYVADAEGNVEFYNRAFVALAGFEPKLGQPLALNLFLPDGTPLPEASCPMSIARKERRAVRGVEAVIERRDGRRTPFIVHAIPRERRDGHTINLLVDIANRKESEAQSRALLNNLIHREKNEIQTIQSLLAGAQRETASGEAKEVLADTARRVGAVAVAQNVIDRKSDAGYAASSLLEALCRILTQSFGRRLDISIEAATGWFANRTALPLAIIVNELVTNSVKHGKGERNRVAVRLSLTADQGRSELAVEDDGPGFTPSPPKRRASGLGLVEGLSRQLGGAIEISSNSGARCVIRFGE